MALKALDLSTTSYDMKNYDGLDLGSISSTEFLSIVNKVSVSKNTYKVTVTPNGGKKTTYTFKNCSSDMILQGSDYLTYTTTFGNFNNLINKTVIVPDSGRIPASYNCKGKVNLCIPATYSGFQTDYKISKVQGSTLYVTVKMNVNGQKKDVTLAFKNFDSIKNIYCKLIETGANKLTDYDLKQSHYTDIINMFPDIKEVDKTGGSTVTGSVWGDTIDLTTSSYAPTSKKAIKNNTGVTIKTYGGDDTITGTQYGDKITGGAGVNTYKYTSLAQIDGDKITLTKGEHARIDLSALNTTATYKVVGKNLEVTADGHTFTIMNFGTKDVVGANGSVTLIDQTGEIDLKTALLSQTNIVKKYSGTWHSDNISAEGYINTKNEKGLTIDGKAGNDVLIGSNYGDTIKAGTTGDTTISGGKGNDKLYAGTDKTSKTTFIFKSGDGLDTVYSGKGEDTIYLNGINIADVDFARGEGKASNDLTIKYTNTDYVVVKNYYKQTNTVKNITTTEGTFTIEDAIAGIGKDRIINGTPSGETITGGVGNDTITGFGGDDTINAGRGNNTIIHNTGDGNDTIIDGGGVDTLVLNGVLSKTDITVSSDGDDIILTRPNSETITLKNVSEGCSINKIRINNADYDTDNFKNHINSAEATVNGTAWHDDINTSSKFANVYAGDGNDTIHVTSTSDHPTIYLGKGKDTVSLEDTDPDCTIYFNKGDGNNVLTGMNNDMSTTTCIYLYSDGLYHTVDMGDELGEYAYILGTMDGDDLVIHLTSGETFRIEDYATLNEATKKNLLVRGHENYSHLVDALKIEDNIINISPIATNYTASLNNGLYLAPDVDFERDINIRGSKDVLLVKGQDYQNVLIGDKTSDIDADYNEIWMYNTGDSQNEDNMNYVNIYGDNNKLYLAGGYGSSVRIESEGNYNSIHILGGKYNAVSTKGASDSSNYIYADATVDEQGYGVNYLYLNGQDKAVLGTGDHGIGLAGSKNKTIDINKEAHKTGLQYVNGTGVATITQKGFEELPTEICLNITRAGQKRMRNRD